jgi:hypothetical protein
MRSIVTSNLVLLPVERTPLRVALNECSADFLFMFCKKD